MPEDKTLLLVDGNALIHRAFHAYPLLTHEGKPINCVYGFARMLIRALAQLKPHYAIVTFDLAKKTFRHEKFALYKAHRVAAPQALYDQIPMVHALVKAFGFPAVGVEGYEADDVIATFTRKAREHKLNVAIMTGDKDTFQLVSEGVSVFTPSNGNQRGLQEVTPEQVLERLGVEPAKVAALKALAGDPSDNIPGVPGIGAKTAVTLLKEFATLEELLAGAKKGDPRIPERLARMLSSHEQEARDAYQLVLLVDDIPITLDLTHSTTAYALSRPALHRMCAEFNFESLLKILPPPSRTQQKALF
jgi:DNA polymerase-1